MNVLKEIIEDIEEYLFEAYCIEGDKNIENIVNSHSNDVPKCGECSRRKFYQVGFNDGIKSQTDNWISVSERLPDEKGWYQCTCSDKDVWENDIVRDLYYYPGLKQFVDNIRYESKGAKDIEKYFWTKYVTAWQALPEPYKGE